MAAGGNQGRRGQGGKLRMGWAIDKLCSSCSGRGPKICPSLTWVADFCFYECYFLCGLKALGKKHSLPPPGLSSPGFLLCAYFLHLRRTYKGFLTHRARGRRKERPGGLDGPLCGWLSWDLSLHPMGLHLSHLWEECGPNPSLSASL